MLIRYCLSEATKCNVDSSMEWVSLAEKAALGVELDVFIIRMIYQEKELSEKTDPSEIEREKVRERLEKLEKFLGSANDLVLTLKKKCSY